ncbi:low temperature requirement protein A [Streptomyces sp. NPDC096311]|uniref:low temperature requirement protein A n=1 Tax=Streptomyces sp. NPDC096311 TaxID=3366083 RepID=UPI0037F34BBA
MNGRRFLERVQQRAAEKQGRARGRSGAGERDRRRSGRPLRLTAAYSDPAHLGERLGLFVLIVLGEGVAQLVAASAGTEWDRELYGLALGSFLLLVLMWSLSLQYGYGGVPGLVPRALRTQTALHLLTTGALAGVAAGLGAAVEHRHDELPPSVRWLLCAGFAVYVLIGAGVSMAAHATNWTSALRSTVPALVLPLFIGVFGNELPSVWAVWLLIPSVAWPQGWHTRQANGSLTDA